MHYYCEIVDQFSTSLFDFELLSGRGSREARRLAIVLHGKGDELDAFLSLQNELELFDFDVLLLNGPTKFAGGFKWMNDEPRHSKSLAVVRDQLLALVEELKDFGYATQNILWIGHSQGGRIAADLLMHSPDGFLGFVGVSTYVGFFEGWASSLDTDLGGAWKTDWLFTHGTHDRIIPIREIRNDIRKLASGKIPLTYREFAKGHDFDYDQEVPYIQNWIRERAPLLKKPSLPIEKRAHRKSEEPATLQ